MGKIKLKRIAAINLELYSAKGGGTVQEAMGEGTEADLIKLVVGAMRGHVSFHIAMGEGVRIYHDMLEAGELDDLGVVEVKKSEKTFIEDEPLEKPKK